jgi:hypothetical protein
LDDNDGVERPIASGKDQEINRDPENTPIASHRIDRKRGIGTGIIRAK